MSGKKKLKFKPSKWDETKPWFYSFYGHEEPWVQRMTARKDRREAKADLKAGRETRKKPRRTGGWISW
jgi:hypothetical protein